MVTSISRSLLIVLTTIAFAAPSTNAKVLETAQNRKKAPVEMAQREQRTAVPKQALGNTETQPDVLELTWEDLVPADYNPYEIFEKYDVDTLDDEDPQAARLLAELREAWNMAPVVKELDGKRIKLPGFVVPLEHEGEKVSEFLLVPYFGACIHVPPPPANQTVYVITQKGGAVEKKLFDTVWVTGTMSAKWTGNELGDAGYTLRASEITAYEEN